MLGEEVRRGAAARADHGSYLCSEGTLHFAQRVHSHSYPLM